MKITDIRATTVTVPLEAPLRHSNGAHWGRFVRTVVEVETDEGITGLGEMGGGGESAALAFAGLKTYLLGHDPFNLNRMRYAICNPTASLYNNRTQLHALSNSLAWISSGKSWESPSISCSAAVSATR
jgi:glucarate dehydratase